MDFIKDAIKNIVYSILIACLMFLAIRLLRHLSYTELLTFLIFSWLGLIGLFISKKQKEKELYKQLNKIENEFYLYKKKEQEKNI